MRLAIISDIHGNLDALHSTWQDIAESDVDAVVSLGDNIGYGGQPDEVVRHLMDHGVPSVVGNHELVLRDPSRMGWFNPVARRSIQRTDGMLSPPVRDYIAGLPDFRVRDDARFVHGFPPDSPLVYFFEADESRMYEALSQYPERICFTGHTHMLQMVAFDGHNLVPLDAPRTAQPVPLEPDWRYLVNVGSVGQPRDGDNRAKYILWDQDDDTLELRSVDYDIAAAAERILSAGMPEVLAHRLY